MLAARKEGKESFSDVIKKEFGKYSLFDLVGILEPGDAEKMREAINTSTCHFEAQYKADQTAG